MKRLNGCGTCGKTLHGVGAYVVGNEIPVDIASRQRSNKENVLMPMQLTRRGISGLGSLGTFDTNLGMTQLITGIPNLYLFGGLALALILITRR